MIYSSSQSRSLTEMDYMYVVHWDPSNLNDVRKIVLDMVSL